MDIKNNCIKPVTAEGTKKIFEQMTKGICKIKNNEIIGTGFLCRIPFINNTKINVLITSYQIIDDYYLKENNKINIFINNNEPRVINLTPERKIYSEKNFNITIIEIKNSDNINNFLQSDENIFRNDLTDYYQFQSIYILQYLFSGSASVSYGILNQLNGYNIKHTCFADSGSNGAPILNLSNNRVIGISLDTKGNNNFNSGVILKYAIERFKNKYTNINQQFMNNNYQIPNMIINNTNFYPNNNLIHNFNMNNNISPWMNMYITPNQNVGLNNLTNGNNNNPNMNVIFTTATGNKDNISVKYGTTIDQLLTKYMIRINRPDLIGDKSYKKIFLFNCCKLRFGDQTPVEKFFKNAGIPKVVVYEDNLIGG